MMNSGLGMITCIMFVYYAAEVLDYISPRAVKYPANDRPLQLYPLKFPLPGVRGKIM